MDDHLPARSRQLRHTTPIAVVARRPLVHEAGAACGRDPPRHNGHLVRATYNPSSCTSLSKRTVTWCTAKTARTGLRKCLADSGSLLALVTDYQDELRAAYDGLSGLRTRNDTSLCLYSGPAVAAASFSTFRSRGLYEHLERPEVGSWDIRPGWLGTGDAPLKGKAEIAEFNRNFNARKAISGYLALPHHGSKYNHNDDIFQGFTSPPTCLVGADGLYGHPHKEVIVATARIGSALQIITTDEASRSVESCTIKFW